MMDRNAEVEIACRVEHETCVGEESEGAYLIDSLDVDEKVWIPKSQVKDLCEEDGVIISIFLPMWLAEDKGLI